MIEKAKLLWRARNAALTALVAFAGMFVSLLVRSIGESRSAAHHSRLLSALLVSAGFAILTFLILFGWSVISDFRMQPVLEILETEAPESERLKKQLSGFVAMEFYWLILNRTYLVFIAPEGLYGWQAQGPVTNADRRYFEPYQQMLEDSDLMSDLPAIQKLADLSGGFFWKSAEIASVAADDCRQWGMGGVVHSGHVRVRLATGKSKNFIILGEAIPTDVRDRIVSTVGVGIISTV